MKRCRTPRHAAIALALAAVVAGTAWAGSNTAATASSEGSLTVRESLVIEAPPANVWSVVADFDGIADWHPAVQSSRISEGRSNQVGARRHLILADGGTIDEALVDYDDSAMTYRYRIIDGVLPVSNYASTIRVEGDGKNSSRLTWSSSFDAAEGTSDADATDVIAGVYRAGLTSVRDALIDE